MATANTYLRVTDLDFNEIRNNLKTYLSSDDAFRDYNFEGSVMATLLDVLAYNTHYNAYYVNMLANEMFLDTAQQRDSVVSRAKELGYLPSSAVGPTANVHIAFAGVSANTAQFIIPKNSKLTTTVDDVTYTFVTPQAVTVLNQGGSFAADMIIKEGEPLTHRWTHDAANPRRFIIPNENVDTSSIVVNVQTSSVDTTKTEYTRATNINQVSSTSPVYFLEEAGDGKYEIVFSPGTLGKPLKGGNIVIVDYVICNADAADGAASFSVDTMNVGTVYTGTTVTTNRAASGGRGQETIDSIKFNAPRNYQTQNRAVVANDYERIVLSENSDIESVVAFGGEQADPAVYGKVYIAIKPYGQKFATNNRKAALKNSISDRTPLGIDPVVINPEYTYIIPNINVYYNATTTNQTEAQIKQSIVNAVLNYSDTNLERFGNRLRYSRFVRALDNVTSGSILNTDATIQIQKRFAPTLDVSQSITLLFNNQIRTLSVNSTQFTYDGFTTYFDDDGAGTIRIYRFDSSRNKIVVKANAGTINYATGKVELTDFSPSAFVDSQIKFSVTPNRLDVIPAREQILLLEENDITITAVGEYE